MPVRNRSATIDLKSPSKTNDGRRDLPENQLILNTPAGERGVLMDDVRAPGEFQPGDLCPNSGLYEAIHHEHRPIHKVIVRRGDCFPQCVRCGFAVRFRLISIAAVEATSTPLKSARRRSAM